MNNIEVEKRGKTTNASLADKAIKKGFDQLIQKILLKKDQDKLLDLNFNSIMGQNDISVFVLVYGD